jgi:beta-galactosidase GanA
MSALYYGVAYYDEYMPEERLEKDIALMLETGINVVRIAESTWSTLEPAEGEYNFYHIDRVLNAMHNAGIAVIVGTPTYAIPSWLATKHPEVMVTTVAGQQKYGRASRWTLSAPFSAATRKTSFVNYWNMCSIIRPLLAGNLITKLNTMTTSANICRPDLFAVCGRNIPASIN